MAAETRMYRERHRETIEPRDKHREEHGEEKRQRTKAATQRHDEETR